MESEKLGKLVQREDQWDLVNFAGKHKSLRVFFFFFLLLLLVVFVFACLFLFLDPGPFLFLLQVSLDHSSEVIED